MNIEVSKMNIYEKLSRITEELGFVEKGLTVGKGTNQYKAVSEASVLNAVKPLEIKHGVYSYPMSREIVMQDILESEKPGYKKDDPPVKKTTFFMRIKTTYRFVNTEKPTEFVDMDTFGDGVDSLDKSSGKAMTYADKYALLKAYKIQTGDDPDANHSNDNPVNRKKKTNEPKGTNGARITAQQKDTIIQQIQDGKNELAPILEYYSIKSLDDLLMKQASSVITEGEK